ncbi:MAG: class I SAM-dependent methyltransferase [Psychrosphaera sp.]|nr:class I SAM-dependent methyltransferase [Psychrosphaera sp.]
MTTTQHNLWTDEMAQSYDCQWGDHPMHHKVVELCGLGSATVVLDIGCGSGTVVRLVADALDCGKVIGVDPTPKMIELARKKTQKSHVAIEFYQSGAEDLPIENHTVDVVLAVNSLHHWADVNAGLNEVRRVLTAKGRLVIIDELWDELPEYQKPKCDDAEQAAHLEAFKSTEVVMATLNDQGFQSITKRVYRAQDVAVSVITAFVD